MCLEVKNINKKWGNGNWVLKNISLSIKKNEFVCIIGPSGCGKTTLLKTIAGIISPDNGGVVYTGKNKKPITDRTAMVFQEPPLYPWKTVWQNVEIGLVFQKVAKKKRQKIVSEKIALSGLVGYELYYPHQLSGGMKQKVQLARVLTLNPDIVLLDEPFAAMDEILRSRFDDYLIELWQKEQKTFIFVTHSIEEAIVLSDRIVMMKPVPGEIHLEHLIEMTRPRDLYANELIQLRKYLRDELSKFY